MLKPSGSYQFSHSTKNFVINDIPDLGFILQFPPTGGSFMYTDISENLQIIK